MTTPNCAITKHMRNVVAKGTIVVRRISVHLTSTVKLMPKCVSATLNVAGVRMVGAYRCRLQNCCDACTTSEFCSLYHNLQYYVYLRNEKYFPLIRSVAAVGSMKVHLMYP
uniref:Apple domain-containing protein n=1 Tax=Ascaris lumbricoides TaxID=6252 RepID=A0A0M3HXG5_ASCLU